jgi:chromatin structure-remodeling complex subunit RSC9
MAPSKPTEPSIERTDEYDEFLETLAKYHEKRGYALTLPQLPCAHVDRSCRTVLDREPKIANQHIDLLRLYKRVVAEGGYDKVSDTKNNKLAWRRLATDLLPGSSANHLTTQAFLIKTAYYKNLAYAPAASSHPLRIVLTVAGRTRYPPSISASLRPRRSSRTSRQRAAIC